jgi:hypothetical protein
MGPAAPATGISHVPIGARRRDAMTQPGANACARNEKRPAGRTGTAAQAIVPLMFMLGAADAARAEDGEWSLLLEPMYMDAFGHDQQILTIHSRDLNSTPPLDAQEPVTLDTDNGLAPRFEIQYRRADWTFGVDFFWFDSSQGRPTRSAAATGAAFEEIVFAVADRTFTSDTPGEVLFFQVLEDTDIIAWTADLYAIRQLAETPTGSLGLQFGVRNADFDNDYHHLVGIENVGGSGFDSRSNYPRMIGPLLGLSANVDLGGGSLRGYLGQSLIFGTATLDNRILDFVGPATDPLTASATELFGKEQDVAIPITEFRINWLYPLGRRISVGVSANTSIWWDVPVPPGLVPMTGGNEVFHENTIVYFGLALAVKLAI